MLRTSAFFAVAAGAAVILAAACTSAPQTTQTADAKPDPRQGEVVRNVCFQQQISSWRELNDHAVIVTLGVKQDYKLDLVGTCRPSDAFTNIGLISRIGGGSCLETGDRLVTDARFDMGPCTITRIYKWNKDATAPAAASRS